MPYALNVAFSNPARKLARAALGQSAHTKHGARGPAKGEISLDLWYPQQSKCLYAHSTAHGRAERCYHMFIFCAAVFWWIGGGCARTCSSTASARAPPRSCAYGSGGLLLSRWVAFPLRFVRNASDSELDMMVWCGRISNVNGLFVCADYFFFIYFSLASLEYFGVSNGELTAVLTHTHARADEPYVYNNGEDRYTEEQHKSPNTHTHTQQVFRFCSFIFTLFSVGFTSHTINISRSF